MNEVTSGPNEVISGKNEVKLLTHSVGLCAAGLNALDHAEGVEDMWCIVLVQRQAQERQVQASKTLTEHPELGAWSHT